MASAATIAALTATPAAARIHQRPGNTAERGGGSVIVASCTRADR